MVRLPAASRNRESANFSQFVSKQALPPLVTKLLFVHADTVDMNESSCEPRRAMWAVAEVSWVDPAGVARTSPGTIEDTSPSGACIRVRDAIALGAKVSVRWHREQFEAVAKNCRPDGYEFLLGVRRTPDVMGTAKNSQNELQKSRRASVGAAEAISPSAGNETDGSRSDGPPSPNAAEACPVSFIWREEIPEIKATPVVAQETQFMPQRAAVGMNSPGLTAGRIAREPRNDTSSGREKKIMEPKNRFPKFWRREPNAGSAIETASMKETSVDNVQAHPAGNAVGIKSSLLSYDDIYRAAGILRARSAYDINKVVEMLHCDRIRNLSDEAKRASVLMAIEAVGASADDLLREAQERQQALDAYEAGQKKQLEDFEARRTKDNAEIEAELARVTAHYADRIKANLDQVAAEKEALRNWQMVKQHESQRIAEVIDLCMKPAEPQPAAMSAAASASAAPSTAPRSAGPSLVSPGATGQ